MQDNPTQQHLYKLIADEVQIIPCIVGTCAEGLEYAKFLNFDLILMDLQMPDLDGIECAKKIQEVKAERGNHSAIIAVTAHAMESDRVRCIEAGMDDYLSKPFSLSDLKAKIEYWAA